MSSRSGLRIIGEPGKSEAQSCCSTAPGPNILQQSEGSVVAPLGFAGNVALASLGCAKNTVDSEVMLGALQSAGFRPVSDAAQADLIVVNTCAFLESAVQEGLDTILSLAEYKKSGRCRQLFVAGCMVERYRDELTASLPEVDRFVSTDELLSIAKSPSTSAECFDSARRPYFLYDETMPRVRSTSGHTTFVKVAEGCDRPCTFCIIPKIRGNFRSRSIDSIVREISTLRIDGVKEFNFVAQDLTSYGADWNGSGGRRSELENLLAAIDQIAPEGPDFWLRLLYAYPIGVTPELIARIAKSPVICKYLDLPLQHVSHPVLKAMQRPLGEKGTRQLIESITHQAPEIALRTTFIVGFPGETDKDIEALRQFVSEGHFAHVGVFTYSQESEAKSFTYADQVPPEVREERKRYIMEAQQAVVAESLEQYIGSTIRVLVDGIHSETDLLLVGRTEWQAPETDGEVIINEVPEQYLEEGGGPSMESLIGQFVDVQITDVAGYDLVGSVTEEDQAASKYVSSSAAAS